MTQLNVFQSGEQLTNISGYSLKFNGLPVDERSERRAYHQSIVSTLCRRGTDATVAPRSDDGDVLVVGDDQKILDSVKSRYNDFRPEVVAQRLFSDYEVGQVWKDHVRTRLLQNSFHKIGNRYVPESEILDTKSEFKESFRIQAGFENQRPTLYVDPRTRIMNQLSEEDIRKAAVEGEESEVSVQILPNWKQGFLVGVSNAKAGDKEFTFKGRDVKLPRYWREKHGIGFVDPSDDLVEVYVPDFDRTLDYPISCVFRSFERGTSLPNSLKKSPSQRVEGSERFVADLFGSVNFAGQNLTFGGPVSVDHLGYKIQHFEKSDGFDVTVGGGKTVTVDEIHRSLKSYGPYAGKISGKYVVISPEASSIVKSGFDELESIYSTLNLGHLERASQLGDDGVIGVGGKHETDYASTITDLRSELDLIDDDLIAFVVLPGNSSSVYYQARGKLFERLFGNQPVPAQAIQYRNVAKLANDDGYFIGVNTATQTYVKLGRIGSAVWVLNEPADSHIPGVVPGSTCYAYHDVSRRPKKKAAATAYSAMTDSYGRYIATGTKPTGGEELTPVVFHDIMVELLQKVSAFNRRFSHQDEHKEFSFQRLLFAKDGYISWKEEQMMNRVIREGVPDEDKRSIETILSDTEMLPTQMIIDVVGVNKSPNKRVFERQGGRYTNVQEGTSVAYDNQEGLLVSFKPREGTAQPMEISLKDHVCLNRTDVQSPSAHDILKEYYHMSHLNWASIFNQGKYALPQILTQNLGENLSAGIETPENMAVI